MRKLPVELKCGLCGCGAILVKSHFIPKGIYRLIRNPNGVCPDPAHVSARKILSTSFQYQKSYLCQECERRFSNFGEKWTIPQLLHNHKFLLRQNVKSCPSIPAFEHFFDCSASKDVDCNKLGYFATSIFWRAAATTWPGIGGEPTTRIALGSYEEDLRAYLLGQAEYPRNSAITLIIGNDDDLECLQCAALPSGGRHRDGFFKYKLQLPGVLFVLYLGKKIPKDIRSQCLLRENRIVIAELGTYNTEVLRVSTRNAQLSGKLKWELLGMSA